MHKLLQSCRVWIGLKATRSSDLLRPGAEAAIAELRAQGKAIKLVSGDTLAALAGRLGIEDFVAGALPAEKAALVPALSAQGRRVLMVGDGLNDTAALAAALAMSSFAVSQNALRLK